MLFNSVDFFIFLPIVFGLYWFVFNKSLTWQNLLILIASYFFYGWWSWKFLGLLALSTLLDYAYGFGVASANKSRSRFFLVLSVINNLGILGIFKYYNFFIAQFQQLFNHIGFNFSPAIIQVALPVGISFYTFHGMSYVFDIYRGHQKPIRNIIDYAVFVSFFPLLVAGPIERASHLLPQVQQKRTFNYQQAVEGCRLILWGLFKKVVIADNLALIVDPIFIDYPLYNGIALVLGALAFSFQIYGDFSGYSDIALGTAKLMGFELLSNFKFPYFSRNIGEFWRRWHISLSSWFRDYLYIPLGGSKNGKLKAVRNTFIIFLVSGFWHGASWNFILWGFIHACAFLPLLIFNRNRVHINNIVATERKIPNVREFLQMVTTFVIVTIAWVFFRSHGVMNAINYLKQMVSTVNHPIRFLSNSDIKMTFICVTSLLIGDWWLRRDERTLRVPRSFVFRNIVYWLIIVALYYNLFASKSSFIYFQF
jgi:alginate O-acetyltransferase complex protein AlgI